MVMSYGKEGVELGGKWIEVTPKGIKRSPVATEQLIAEWGKNLTQLYYIIKAQKKRRGFRKVLGNLWLIVDPILHACLYYFITQIIFSHGGSNRFLMIFTAVTFWRLHSKMVGSAPDIFVNRAAILRQTNFPASLIVTESTIVDIMFFSYKVLVLLLFLTVCGIRPSTNWLWLPFVFLTQISFSVCLVIGFSIVGTFVRDLRNVLTYLMPIWFYLTPGIYDISRVPLNYRDLFMLNPFAHILPAYQSILIKGESPDVSYLFMILIISLCLLLIEIKLLNKARYYFFKFL